MKYASIKILLSACLILLAANLGYSQKGKKGGDPATTNSNTDSGKAGALNLEKHYDNIFHNALNFGDLATATEAIYGILSIKPDSVALLDTLAALYFQRAAWPQVVLVTTHALEKNPTNQGALELRAVANQSLGRAKESLEDYESLYTKNQNPYHLYEISSLQFAMKRFGECELSTKRLIADPDIKDKAIMISTQEGKSQEVPLKAAGLNLIGVMNLEQGKKAEAKSAFEAAIQVFPDFVLAKNNLDAMKEMK